MAWLPNPRAPTCKGYAKFLNIPHMPVTAYIACTSMFTKLPAYRNARLAQRGPEGPNSQETLASESDSHEEGQKRPTFPVVVFSHGLGGSRTSHSAICGELASFGLVVVAMEHRDGSGARTYVNKPGTSSNDLKGDELDRSPEKPQSEGEAQAGQERKGKKERNYYKVDYIFPKDNAQDTSPHNPIGVDTELRGAQIEMRLAEIQEAFHVLSLMNCGQGGQIVGQNLRKKETLARPLVALTALTGLTGTAACSWIG